MDILRQDLGPYHAACKELDDEIKALSDEVAKMSGVRETETGEHSRVYDSPQVYERLCYVDSSHSRLDVPV